MTPEQKVKHYSVFQLWNDINELLATKKICIISIKVTLTLNDIISIALLLEACLKNIIQ